MVGVTVGAAVGVVEGCGLDGAEDGSGVVGAAVGATELHWVVSRKPLPKQDEVSSSPRGQLVRHAVRDWVS